MLLFATQVEGTLTDDSNYQLGSSERELRLLADAGIPVILCSTRTFDELRVLARSLGLMQPFLFENGSAIAIPKVQFFPYRERIRFSETPEYYIVERTPEEFDVRHVLSELEKELDVPFVSLRTGSDSEILDITGYSYTALRRAKRRRYSDAILFRHHPPRLPEMIRAICNRHGALAVPGPKYISIVHKDATMGSALKELKCFYDRRCKNVHMMAAGDASCDVTMLGQADVGLLISAHQSDLNPGLSNTILIHDTGPEGFHRACDMVSAFGKKVGVGT